MDSPKIDFKASYSPKLILAGEHAVVHGFGAIAMPLNANMSLSIDIERGSIASFIPDTIQKILEKFVKERELLAEFRNKFHLDIKSSIPISAGLGSSAAFSAAVSDLIFFIKNGFEVKEIAKIDRLRLANEIEKEFHKTPSGIDVTTVIENKMIFFKSIENHDEIPNNTTDLFATILNTGPRNCLTKDAIAALHLEKNYPLFKTIGEISEELRHAFQIADYKMIAELLNENHKILTFLGCVTEKMQEAVEFLISNGAIAAKMTGAGFGGSVFGIFRFAKNKIHTHLKQHKAIISALQNPYPVKELQV